MTNRRAQPALTGTGESHWHYQCLRKWQQNSQKIQNRRILSCCYTCLVLAPIQHLLLACPKCEGQKYASNSLRDQASFDFNLLPPDLQLCRSSPYTTVNKCTIIWPKSLSTTSIRGMPNMLKCVCALWVHQNYA